MGYWGDMPCSTGDLKYVEYGEEERPWTTKETRTILMAGNFSKLSRADHMIIVRCVLHSHTHCIKLVKLERVGIHCIVLFSRCLEGEGLLLQI